MPLTLLTIYKPFSGQYESGTIQKNAFCWNLDEDTACRYATSFGEQDLSKGVKNIKGTELNHLQNITSMRLPLHQDFAIGLCFP